LETKEIKDVNFFKKLEFEAFTKIFKNSLVRINVDDEMIKKIIILREPMIRAKLEEKEQT